MCLENALLIAFYRYDITLKGAHLFNIIAAVNKIIFKHSYSQHP